MGSRHQLIPRLVEGLSYLLRGTGIACHTTQDLSALVQVVDQKAIEAVSERLRDTKRSVRRDAAVHLMAVFRSTACIACCFILAYKDAVQQPDQSLPTSQCMFKIEAGMR